MTKGLCEIFTTRLNLKTDSEFLEFLEEQALKNNIPLTKEQAIKQIEFLEILVKASKNFNLTSILEFEDMVYKHILDSLLLLKVVDFEKFTNLLDVGAGAGFPSTPIAILEKFEEIVQIDSILKRVNFLEDVREKLKLNVKIFHKRAEEAAKDLNFREKFKVVSARAVAKLNILCELCLPFVENAGFFIALKGPNYEEELNLAERAIKILGGRLERIEKFNLNGMTRVLILIKKISHSSTKYPRSFAKISKNPL